MTNFGNLILVNLVGYTLSISVKLLLFLSLHKKERSTDKLSIFKLMEAELFGLLITCGHIFGGVFG